MKINYRVIESYGLTLDEFLILLIKQRNINVEEIEESLKDKDLLFRSENQLLDGKIKEAGLRLVQKALRESVDKKTEERFESLADKLRELFPRGSKDGKHQWRGSTKQVADRLMLMESKFGKFTDEQAIDATKRYLEAYNNGNEPFMRTLPYFIIKVKRADGITELVSDLMSYIENEDAQIQNDSWTREMR